MIATSRKYYFETSELEKKLECPVLGCNLQLKAFAIKFEMSPPR